MAASLVMLGADQASAVHSIYSGPRAGLGEALPDGETDALTELDGLRLLLGLTDGDSLDDGD